MGTLKEIALVIGIRMLCIVGAILLVLFVLLLVLAVSSPLILVIWLILQHV